MDCNRRASKRPLPIATLVLVALVAPACAHQTDKASKRPGDEAELQDTAARATRENAALRRRVQMLEDRVLHLEQNGGDSPTATAMTLPNGRDLPVVRLTPDPRSSPNADTSVSARTWQATTAPQTAHRAADDPNAAMEPAGSGRRSRTIGTQPSPLAVDPTDELGGFAGGPIERSTDDSRSYRLVGSRLAELSKSERKPAAADRAQRPAKRRKSAGRGVLARYEEAMATLKAGRADVAEAAFARIAADHPRHDYADNALYWKGESAYDQRHYADALAAFTQVVEQYGGGNKAPDALLKIGLCYNNLGDLANARDVLVELVAAYPGARASGIARVKLAELSSGSAQGN